MSTQDPQGAPPPQGYPTPQGYPPPQGYPTPQGYPPTGAPYAAPYAPPQPPYANMKPRAVENPLALRALVYGIISFVLFVAIFFTNFIVLATFGLYAIYYAIRGLIYAVKIPGHRGIIPSVIGLFLSIISILGTLGVIVLDAMLTPGG